MCGAVFLVFPPFLTPRPLPHLSMITLNILVHDFDFLCTLSFKGPYELMHFCLTFSNFNYVFFFLCVRASSCTEMKGSGLVNSRLVRTLQNMKRPRGRGTLFQLLMREAAAAAAARSLEKKASVVLNLCRSGAGDQRLSAVLCAVGSDDRLRQHRHCCRRRRRRDDSLII